MGSMNYSEAELAEFLKRGLRVVGRQELMAAAETLKTAKYNEAMKHFIKGTASAGAMQMMRRKPIEIDGYKFPSKKESERYLRLKAELQDGGIIRSLEVHPWWKIAFNGIEICRVTADFSYERYDIMERGWVKVVEDVKSERRGKDGKLKFTTDTARSKLNRKLVLAAFGIEIKVVK